MRDTIVGAIATAISTVKGIKTITDWYTDQITDSMLPLANILDKVDDISQEGGINHHTLTVEIDLYHKGTSSALRMMIDDIIEAMQLLKSSVVNDVNVERVAIDKESESNQVFIATITFTFNYSDYNTEVVQC